MLNSSSVIRASRSSIKSGTIPMVGALDRRGSILLRSCREIEYTATHTRDPCRGKCGGGFSGLCCGTRRGRASCNACSRLIYAGHKVRSRRWGQKGQRRDCWGHAVVSLFLAPLRREIVAQAAFTCDYRQGLGRNGAGSSCFLAV